jgi:chorismate mutase
MPVQGIRGAVIVSADEPELILQATRNLLEALLQANPDLHMEDLASVLFTMTPDLYSVHPAQAAREMGWNRVPLFCLQEIPVPDGLPRVIRVLAHWNTNLPQDSIRHVYLGEAVSLRPDLSGA